MSKPNYWELLKDPRWQQMRLRVMEREGFTCQDCEDKTATLNVHHTYYEKGNAPWEYPEDSLHCLCETCHKRAEAERILLLKAAGALSRERRLAATGIAF
jgi:5-methylcytosine-specific restriction endonuclease McrA